ncbi:Chaperone protein DnaK [Botrytis cinerea]
MSVMKLRNVVNNQSASKGRLIMGIDMGTTRGAVADLLLPDGNQELGHQHEPEPFLFADWKGSWGSGDEFPLTALYYNENDQQETLPMTGHELRMLLDSATPFNTERFFPIWKLLFHDSRDPVTASLQKPMLARLEKLNKTREDLLRDWVSIVYKELIYDSFGNLPALRKGVIPDLEDLKIEVIVPVPPGRSTIAHEMVRNALVQGPITSEQVFLVSEPECSFGWWCHIEAEKGQHEWKIGTRYIVLDAGGGTACTVTYKLTGINPPRFKQEFESESMICGAETISENFRRLLDAKVPEGIAHRPWAIQHALNSFNKGYKNYFGISKDPRPFCILIPGLPLERLVIAVKRQMNRDRESVPDYLIMGGGMCLNTYISEALRKEFRQLKVCQLRHNKAHIVKGAVWLRSQQDFITRRPLKYTIGIVTSKEVDFSVRRFSGKGYRSEDTWKNQRDGKHYISVVYFLAKKGQLVDSSYKVTSEGFKDARLRYSTSALLQDLSFEDVVYTINYTPDQDEKFVFVRQDGRLVNIHGALIRDPEKSDRIRWNAMDSGIDLRELKQKRFRESTPSYMIKYTIHAEMTDVDCKYCVMIFSISGQQHGFCGDLQVKSITDIQQISENLSQSFAFGQREVAPARASKQTPTGASERPTKKVTRSSVRASNLQQISKAANAMIGERN